MAQEPAKKDGRRATPAMTGRGATPYEKAALGFRNYWYPAFLAQHVTERRPKAVTLLGDEIVFLRRQGVVYALADECPHRGTRLSRGKHEFPGTPTIACRYHGWVFDVTNGACVAALTDGPDSPVVGKVRVRTYPVEVRKGIVWIWMGRMASVPLEEDVPSLVLRDDTWLNVHSVEVSGNWRWHAENVAGGHAFMVHRDSIHVLFTQLPGYAFGIEAKAGDAGEDGTWLSERGKGAKVQDDYPGLGPWPRLRPWRRKGDVKLMGKDHLPRPVRGVRYPRASLRLPGVTRITHAPITGCMYYEWYVPVDEDHYTYFQLSCYWPTSIIDRLWFYVRYFGYGRWAQLVRFNSQDKLMVHDATDYAKRHGFNWPSPLYRPDAISLAWRRLCNEQARGEEVLPAEPEEEPSEPAEVSLSPW